MELGSISIVFDAATLALFVTGSTQVIKMAGVSSRYLPAIAVILGGLINGCLHLDGTLYQISNAIVYGLFIGLTTTGLINYTKNE